MIIPDGNEVLLDDMPTIVGMISRTARWVHPETFRQLPVWQPQTARGHPLYDASWTRPARNETRNVNKVEGNVAAIKTLIAALDVGSPRPRNWTVCHVWGYDDPRFAKKSEIVQDPRYFTCVANMVWLPTPLKGFTDSIPQIKAALRVCAFHMYGWICEHPSVASEAARIASGWRPELYPRAWPSAENKSLLPPGTAQFTPRVQAAITKRKNQIRDALENSELTHYPRQAVREVLRFWQIQL